MVSGLYKVTGYTLDWRIRILTGAVKGYKRILKLASEGKTDIHGSAKSTVGFRRWKKVVGPYYWFKTKKSEEDQQYLGGGGRKRKSKGKGDLRTPEGVMFIPTTPRGARKKKLQYMDQAVGFRNRCRYVETVGQSILSILFKKDHWKIPCGQPKNLLCVSEPGSFTAKGVVYNMECLICTEDHQLAIYMRENARAPYERGLEHLALIKNQSKESPLTEHQREKHPEEEEVRVSMKVVSREPRPWTDSPWKEQ